MKKILLIVGKSGSGKSFIASCLEKLYGWKSVISYTTRKPRFDGETGHIFVQEKDMPSKDEMVAYTEFNGHKYWATQAQVEESQIYIIDPKGVETFKKHYKGSKDVIVFYIDCDIVERFNRMRQRIIKNNPRGIVSPDFCEAEALKRIENDGMEFQNFVKKCEYPVFTIENNSTDLNSLLSTIAKIKTIVEKQ